MKQATTKDIEKMSMSEFIEQEYEYAVNELIKMGIFKEEKNEPTD